jgi:hypothetical protein
VQGRGKDVTCKVYGEGKRTFKIGRKYRKSGDLKISAFRAETEERDSRARASAERAQRRSANVSHAMPAAFAFLSFVEMRNNAVPALAEKRGKRDQGAARFGPNMKSSLGSPLDGVAFLKRATIGLIWPRASGRKSRALEEIHEGGGATSLLERLHN